jgi:hypothetical protein
LMVIPHGSSVSPPRSGRHRSRHPCGQRDRISASLVEKT